jgi:hypothetical protein
MAKHKEHEEHEMKHKKHEHKKEHHKKDGKTAIKAKMAKGK